MQAVDDVFPVLQPVARDDGRPATADARIIGFNRFAGLKLLQHVVVRQQRLGLRRAQVRKDEAVALLQRIPRLAHVVAQGRAAVGLAGLVKAMPLHIEHPAVITATQTPQFHPAIEQRGTAVRAARAHQAGPARAVAKQDQVLAQHAHGPRLVAGIGRQAYRVPITPHQLTHWRAGADFGQARVVGLVLQTVGGAMVDAGL